MPGNDNPQDDEKDQTEDGRPRPSDQEVTDAFKRRHRDRGDDEYSGIW